MHKISVSYAEYMGIRSGLSSSIVIDESEKYLVDIHIAVYTDEHLDGDEFMPVMICTINYIGTNKMVKGLKAGYSLVSLSVVRLEAYDNYLSMF